MEAIGETDPKKAIIIKGAHLHNLKNIDVSIPRNQLVVITGMSGSGKFILCEAISGQTQQAKSRPHPWNSPGYCH